MRLAALVREGKLSGERLNEEIARRQIPLFATEMSARQLPLFTIGGGDGTDGSK